MDKNGMSLKSFFFFLVFFWLPVFAWGHINVSPEQAKTMINTNNELIVIDVRELGDYCGFNGHIPGARNYPWNSGVLQARYTELPVDAYILAVCGVGGRSNSAASFLDSNGYLHVYDMLGGMSAWTYDTVRCVDTDIDGINDDLDNCPSIPNSNQGDADSDEAGDVCDNCPNNYNRHQIDCDNDGAGDICDPNTVDQDGDGVDDGEGAGHGCDNCPATPNNDQSDSYPPGGNGCGDACECEGNFDDDLDVDGTDASTFKMDFGRSKIVDPCTNALPCDGDIECDTDVDGTNASQFKVDFGRSKMVNPCPICATEPWCVYP
jgi:rhodanese-related sulfurtransferase